jgi:hypothetical protein
MRALVASVVVAALGCDTGSGTSTFLEPGLPTTAPPSDDVLYVSLSTDDRVIGYRLGQDGLLPAQPFTSMDLENPRVIVLGNGILYVLMEDRVVALTLEPDGSLPARPSSQSAPIEDAEGVDMLLGDGVLYVAFEDLNRIFTFALEGGQIPLDPISISGTSTSDYMCMVIGGEFLYAASFGDASIETYLIQPDGSLPPVPEPQEPFTEIFRPDDMLVNGDVLYAITQSRERIEAFNIRPNGLLPEEYDSRTSSEQRYARLVLDGDRLYASGIGKGRIDVYIVNPDGSLPTGDPFARTESDAATFPVDILLDNGILYVAQSGLGRIDAYILNGDGSPAEFPSSSTDAIPDSFPVGLALGSFAP